MALQLVTSRFRGCRQLQSRATRASAKLGVDYVGESRIVIQWFERCGLFRQRVWADVPEW
jgi:hypothetical protein